MKDETKLDILLREYVALRAEILERLKLAYQQLGWAGAVVAFALPLAASSSATPEPWWIALKVGFALLGVTMLVWLSVLNWLWLRNNADQLRLIEAEVEKQSGGSALLTWERRVSLMSRGVLQVPRKPEEVPFPSPRLAPTAGTDPAAPASAK